MISEAHSAFDFSLDIRAPHGQPDSATSTSEKLSYSVKFSESIPALEVTSWSANFIQGLTQSPELTPMNLHNNSTVNANSPE